jgi:hypothetical protein
MKKSFNIGIIRPAAIFAMAFGFAAAVAGCASKPSPISYALGAEQHPKAFIELQAENPKVEMLGCATGAEEYHVPAAEKKTYWSPVAVPAGKALSLNVRAMKKAKRTGLGYFFGGIIGAAIEESVAGSHDIDQPVTFKSPPLEAGKTYSLVYDKKSAADITLVLLDKETGAVLSTQNFAQEAEAEVKEKEA